MRTYFVRHGESVNNTLWTDLAPDHDAFFRQRFADALTDRGVLQITHAAARLRRDFPDISEIWASYLHRALATAQAVAKEFPHAVCRAMPELSEVGGHYCWREGRGNVGSPGRSNADVLSEFPNFVVDGRCDDGWWHDTGAESASQANARAEAVADALAQRAKSGATDAIAIVTHGDFFNRVFATISAMEEKEANEEVIVFREDQLTTPVPISQQDSSVASGRGFASAQAFAGTAGGSNGGRSDTLNKHVLFRNTSVTVVEWNARGVPKVVLLNCAAHLDGVVEDVLPGRVSVALAKCG